MTNPKQIISRKVVVDFPQLGLKNVLAKIDTGAYRGTLHCTDVKLVEQGGKQYLSFVPLDLRHPDFSHKPVVFNHYTKNTFRSTNGFHEDRYVIETEVVVDGQTHVIEISLSDRTDMRAPVLLGRRFLRGKYIVDVDKYVG